MKKEFPRNWFWNLSKEARATLIPGCSTSIYDKISAG